jgi:hypothetical protein
MLDPQFGFATCSSADLLFFKKLISYMALNCARVYALPSASSTRFSAELFSETFAELLSAELLFSEAPTFDCAAEDFSGDFFGFSSDVCGWFSDSSNFSDFADFFFSDSFSAAFAEFSPEFSPEFSAEVSVVLAVFWAKTVTRSAQMP